MLPIHPGGLLLQELLNPLGIGQYRMAKEVSIPPGRINEIVPGKRAISVNTALRLARYFGTTDDFMQKIKSKYNLDKKPTQQYTFVDAATN